MSDSVMDMLHMKCACAGASSVDSRERASRLRAHLPHYRRAAPPPPEREQERTELALGVRAVGLSGAQGLVEARKRHHAVAVRRRGREQQVPAVQRITVHWTRALQLQGSARLDTPHANSQI